MRTLITALAMHCAIGNAFAAIAAFESIGDPRLRFSTEMACSSRKLTINCLCDLVGWQTSAASFLVFLVTSFLAHSPISTGSFARPDPDSIWPSLVYVDCNTFGFVAVHDFFAARLCPLLHLSTEFSHSTSAVINSPVIIMLNQLNGLKLLVPNVSCEPSKVSAEGNLGPSITARYFADETVL